MAGSRFNAFVTHYTAEELDGMTALLTPDGKTGLAVHDHGDGRVEATAVFSAPGQPKGAGAALLARAVKDEGVNYLECYGSRLRSLYEGVGFKVTEEHPFDESLAAEGWNYEKFGRPPYFIMRFGSIDDVGETKAARPEPHVLTAEEIDAILAKPMPDEGGDPEWLERAALAVVGGLPADEGDGSVARP